MKTPTSEWFKTNSSRPNRAFVWALNLLITSTATAASKVIPNNNANLHSNARTTACGQNGSLKERINDCNEFIILKESNARITTVSIHLADGKLERWLLDESTRKIWSPPAKLKMNFPNAEKYCKNFNKSTSRPLGLSNWSLPIVKNDYVRSPDLTGGLISAFNNPPVNRFGGLTNPQDDTTYMTYSKNPLVKKVFNSIDAFWVYKSTENNIKRWLNRSEPRYGEVESIFATVEGRELLTVSGISSELYVLCQSGKIQNL